MAAQFLTLLTANVVLLAGAVLALPPRLFLLLPGGFARLLLAAGVLLLLATQFLTLLTANVVLLAGAVLALPARLFLLLPGGFGRLLRTAGVLLLLAAQCLALLAANLVLLAGGAVLAGAGRIALPTGGIVLLATRILALLATQRLRLLAARRLGLLAACGFRIVACGLSLPVGIASLRASSVRGRPVRPLALGPLGVAARIGERLAHRRRRRGSSVAIRAAELFARHAEAFGGTLRHAAGVDVGPYRQAGGQLGAPRILVSDATNLAAHRARFAEHPFVHLDGIAAVAELVEAAVVEADIAPPFVIPAKVAAAALHPYVAHVHHVDDLAIVDALHVARRGAVPRVVRLARRQRHPADRPGRAYGDAAEEGDERRRPGRPHPNARRADRLRRPAPAWPDAHPAAVMRWREAPRRRIDPYPAEWLPPLPGTVAVGRPTLLHGRIPDVAVLRIVVPPTVRR